MKKIVYLLSAITLCIASLQVQAQGFEGVVEMEMIYGNLPPEMQAYKSMLPKETKTLIKGKKARVEKPGAMGMETVVIIDRDKEMSYFLIDAMGQKMYVTQAIDDGNEEENQDVDVEYFDEEKTIAGYKCKRAEVTDGDETIEIWYTTEISSDASPEFSVLKGFPMQYTIEAEGMEITVRAKRVEKKKLDKSLFVVPAEYEEVSEEDLGGMMGGGF